MDKVQNKHSHAMMSGYEFPKDWFRLKEDFQRLFPVGIGDFYDSFLSALTGQFCIDLVQFDTWLHTRYGEYEDAGLSMEDVIMKHYGAAACGLIENLL